MTTLLFTTVLLVMIQQIQKNKIVLVTILHTQQIRGRLDDDMPESPSILDTIC